MSDKMVKCEMLFGSDAWEEIKQMAKNDGLSEIESIKKAIALGILASKRQADGWKTVFEKGDIRQEIVDS